MDPSRNSARHPSVNISDGNALIELGAEFLPTNAVGRDPPAQAILKLLCGGEADRGRLWGTTAVCSQRDIIPESLQSAAGERDVRIRLHEPAAGDPRRGRDRSHCGLSHSWDQPASVSVHGSKDDVADDEDSD
jgi:hypothetical protein